MSETYLELSQTSNMELLQKIANCFKSFFIFTKSSILFLCTTLYILTNKCFIVQKNTGKIVLQYLMILQHSNIAHSPFITIKYKKFANNDILKNSQIQKNGWSIKRKSFLLLYCSERYFKQRFSFNHEAKLSAQTF